MPRIHDRAESVKTPDSFVQIPSALLHSGISGAALLTYAVIRETAWAVGDEYFRGNEDLAREAGVKDAKTVYRHLQELEQAGAIEITRIGKRRANRITILPPESIVCVRANLPDHRASDRAQMPVHIAPSQLGDRAQMPGTIGQECPIHSEVDDMKKTSDLDEHLKSDDQTSEGEKASGPAGGLLEGEALGASPSSPFGLANTPCTHSDSDERQNVDQRWAVLEPDGTLYVHTALGEAPSLRDAVERVISVLGVPQARAQLRWVWTKPGLPSQDELADITQQLVQVAISEAGIAAHSIPTQRSAMAQS